MTTSRALAVPVAPRARAVTILLAALVASVVLPVGPARASGEAADLTRWIAEERAGAGVHGLQVAGDLVEVATRHAQRMAAEGRLHHNPTLSSEVEGWERLTENVGHGPDARRVHEALMASSSHRANTLDTGVTQVGVGVAWGDGTLWVAQVFRRPSGGGAPPPPPPPPPPAPIATPPRPSTPAAPAAPAPVSEPAVVLVHDDVAPAPPPSVLVDTASAGEVASAPMLVHVHLLTATRWLTLLRSLGFD